MADFLGLVNLLPGVIADGVVLLDYGPRVQAALPEGARPGQRVMVVVRPEVAGPERRRLAGARG